MPRRWEQSRTHLGCGDPTLKYKTDKEKGILEPSKSYEQLVLGCGLTLLMSCRIFIADAFAGRAFQGNPAAVCLVPDLASVTDAALLAVAAEMNLSETAFVSPVSSPGGGGGGGVGGGDPFATADRFLLRWFTPMVEVNLCGHATLATAAVLQQECGNRK